MEGPIQVVITDYSELHTIDQSWDVVWDTGFIANPTRVNVVHNMIFSIASGLKEVVKMNEEQRKEIFARHYAILEQYCQALGIPISIQNEALRAELMPNKNGEIKKVSRSNFARGLD